ncbi:hypothetical protein V6Z11_D12G211900 [Gossypium hirsutum]
MSNEPHDFSSMFTTPPPAPNDDVGHGEHPERDRPPNSIRSISTPIRTTVQHDSFAEGIYSDYDHLTCIIHNAYRRISP